MKNLPLTLTERAVKPARLCSIHRRDGTVLRIAEAQSAITPSDDATAYAVVAGVEISGVRHTLGGDVPSMEITAAHSDGGTFDTADIDRGLYDAAEVYLYIVNRANPTVRGLMFAGTIQPVTYNIAGQVKFDVRGHAVATARTKYLQHFSPMCRTDLFSTLCGLNPASFVQTAAIATIINRFNFTISSLSPGAVDGYFNGGVIVTDGGIAFEVAHWDQSDNQITAFLPCNRLISVAETIQLYPGCDKRIATCLSKFNNTANFQGEPHSIGIYAAISGS